MRNNISVMLIAALIAVGAHALHAQELLKIKASCNYYGNAVSGDVYGFTSDAEAQTAVSRIMKYTGLPQNFVIMAANVDSAEAGVQENPAGGIDRYLLYNQDFMLLVKDLTHTDWAAISIMAHEIGHHLAGHTLQPGGSRPKEELEADKFSAFVLYRMGATLAEAKVVMETIASDAGSDTHPPKSARLAAITNGWIEAREQNPLPTPQPTPSPLQGSTNAEPAAGEIWREPTTGMEFVWIPGGAFDMGSPDSEPGRSSNESPVHRVTLTGLWMSAKEVTNAQYRRFKPDHNSGDYNGYSLNDDNQPVVMVSWNDAKAFTEWLSEQNRGTATFRLSSEAEWEYAARAGKTTSRFWGDNPNDACAYANVHDRTSKQAFTDWTHAAHDCTDNYAVSAPVGSFQANAFGLYDMLGNVWEWCADTYHENYNGAPKHGEIWGNLSDEKANRLLRGGSWSSDPSSVRCADRYYDAPANRYGPYGMRVVCVR